jgi:4-methylaminobutanoate oxidase (formaldehyde-forming)
MYAGDLFPRLEVETGQSTGYRRTGGFWLARRPERMDELRRIAALGRHFGLSPEIVEQHALAAALPGIRTDGIVGAMAVAEDASVNPVDLCMAYARAARSLGVTIREGCDVAALEQRGGRIAGVRLTDGSVIAADQVALCAGAWSKRLADAAGVALPLQAVEHMYVVTAPIPGLAQPFPLLRDLDSGTYIKGDAGKLIIGGFEPDAKCWDAFGPEGNRPFLELPEDWDQVTPFMQAALALVPALETVGIQRFMNGPESFTVDTRPLIGETPEIDGLFVAAGMNSVGVMSSAGIGRVLADWMIDGTAPMNLWEVDIARVDPRTASPAHVATRMREAVSDQFALHWPFKQPVAGRGLRQSALHSRWAAAGAHFGLTAGWERGLWYARDATERNLPYAVGAQPWERIVRREAAAMQSGCVLLDLSPFGKFDVSGPEALRFLNHLATAQIDVAPGRVVYTQLLNAAGGIEADVTVSRIGTQSFRITSGAATRVRDGAVLRRAAHGFDLQIDDRTEDEVVIGVMGAAARTLLASLSPDDWADFAFSTSRAVTVCGVACHATRLSFVGELGWELSIPAAAAGPVFDALLAGGATPMGHFALDGCRVEKGLLHWGHDIGPDITPLEAGLGFTIDWSKDFQGKTALLAQRKAGLSRRLLLLCVTGAPLVLHDEPIWENGRVVGLTTSGAKGPRTGLTLAFGLIDVAPEETWRITCARHFDIDIAGRRYGAMALPRPPYDPERKRMTV